MGAHSSEWTPYMKAQRVRITFARGDETKYITHLDLMRFWERALRRAEIPVAYSEGFSPHAQLSMAAPLAVGTTSEAELMDVYLAEAMPPAALMRQMSAQLPVGLSIVAAEEVGMALPALQADVRAAEYMVDVEAGLGTVRPSDGSTDREGDDGSWRIEDGSRSPSSIVHTPSSGRDGPPPADANTAVESFLAASTIPWEHKRQNETRSYDIRALVETIEIAQRDGDRVTLRMRLKNDSSGSGRPEQVVAALGLPAPARIHRTRLVLARTSPSREAWRARGRFAD